MADDTQTTEQAGGNADVQPKKNDFILESNDPQVKAETDKEETPKESPKKADDATEEVDPDKDNDGEGKKKRTGYQRKMDAKDAEIARLNAKIAAGGNAGDKGPAKAVDADEKEPSPDDYPTWGEFTKALVKFETKQTVKAAEETRTKKSSEDEARKSFDARKADYASSEEETRKLHKDYDEVTEEFFSENLNPALQTALIYSDLKSEVSYYLASNPEEGAKVAKMGIIDMNKAIAKIEAKLESGKVAEKPAVKTSKAPPPVQPVGNGSSTDTGEFYEGMPYEKFKAWDARQKNK